jgi:hypothetical protein
MRCCATHVKRFKFGQCSATTRTAVVGRLMWLRLGWESVRWVMYASVRGWSARETSVFAVYVCSVVSASSNVVSVPTRRRVRSSSRRDLLTRRRACSISTSARSYTPLVQSQFPRPYQFVDIPSYPPSYIQHPTSQTQLPCHIYGTET